MVRSASGVCMYVYVCKCAYVYVYVSNTCVFANMRVRTYINWSAVDMCLYAAQEASWRRVFDPYAPLLFNLYHYLEQNLHFGLVPENQF